MSNRPWISMLSILMLTSLTALPAQAPKVGDPAPSFALKSWLNLDGTRAPTNESLIGKVVMIEFWGTWCGPCMSAMPQVQTLHERYRERGVVVLAISYETTETMMPALNKMGWTMIIGSDPEKSVITSYGIKSWPTTFVIGKDGNIAYVGSPHEAEAAVDEALGLESSPAILLTAWLDTLNGKDAEAQRSTLERLVEKSTAGFDLRAWARGQGGEEAEEPSTADEVDGTKALDDCVTTWKKEAEEERALLLNELANRAPEFFDLTTWVEKRFNGAYPINAKEMKDLLARERWEKAISGITSRRPKGAVVAVATKNKEFRKFCKEQLAARREAAKKGIMAYHWSLQGRQSRDNEAFWHELSVNSFAFSKDRKKVLGIVIAADYVTAARAPHWIHSKPSEAIVMEAIAEGSAPSFRSLPKNADKAYKIILAELEARYGEND